MNLNFVEYNIFYIVYVALTRNIKKIIVQVAGCFSLICVVPIYGSVTKNMENLV